jgi:hypothetical protein
MLRCAGTTVRSYGVAFIDYFAINSCYFLYPLHCCVFAKDRELLGPVDAPHERACAECGSILLNWAAP